MLPISATQWIFGDEPLEITLERLKKYGYDGIELAGDASYFNQSRIANLLQQQQIVCTSICGMYTNERDLSSTRSSIRSQGVTYVKQCIDLAAMVGAPLVIVVPSPVGVLGPDGDMNDAWKAAVQSLIECGEYASSNNVQLAIESLNRYETYLVNRMSSAFKLMNQVSHPNVKLMADVFHMNLEERDIGLAIREHVQHIIHVHLADNTREVPGVGSIDFQHIVGTLLEGGYNGSLTMEFMPSTANPYEIALGSRESQLHDMQAKSAIDYIRSLSFTVKG